MTAFFATVRKRTSNESFRIAFVLHEVWRDLEPELNERIRRLPMTCVQFIRMSRCNEDISGESSMGDADRRKEVGITGYEYMKVIGSSYCSTNEERHDKRIDLFLLKSSLDQLP